MALSQNVEKVTSKKRVSIARKTRSAAAKINRSSPKKANSINRSAPARSTSPPRRDRGRTESSSSGRRGDDSVRLSDRASEIADKDRKVENEEGQVNQNEGVNENEETNQAGPPDFNKMTPQEQYDYLQNTVVQQAGGDESAWKTGEGEVNLVGVRSWENGQPGGREGNEYNDTIYVARMENGEPKIDAFTASVDGGVWDPAKAQQRGFGVTSNGEWKGISHLADGHYRDTWVKGQVPLSDLGLRQAGDVRVHADGNSDGVIQNNERLGSDITGDGIGDGETKGAGWGIQFHPGGTGENVGQYSAGCQVIKAQEYDRFKQIIANAPNSRFSYTLVDSSNLPQVGAQHAFDGTPPPANVPEAPVGGGVTTPAGTPSTPAPAAPAAPAATPSTPATGQTPDTAPANPVYSAPAQVPATEGLPGAYGPAAGHVGENNGMNPGSFAPMGMMGMGVMDQQVMMMCMAAIQEIEQGVKNGPAVQMLAQWQQMAGQNNIPVSAQTKNMVISILQGAGIKVGQTARGASKGGNAANTTYNGGHGGIWGASPLNFYK